MNPLIFTRMPFKARFQELGAQAVPQQPSDYKAIVQAETSLFTEIVRSRGISAE